MADTLAELAVQISVDMGKLKSGLNNAGKELDKFERQAEQDASQLRKTLAGFAVGVGAAVVASVKKFADLGSEIHDMAIRTGLGTEAISELRYAAEQSGTSIAGLEVGIRRMSQAITDADAGMKESILAFERIGIKVEDLMGLKPEDQFLKIATALATVENDALRTASAVDLFGRSGTQLLPMLDDGADGLNKMRQEARELGIVFSEEAAEKADALGDSFNRLKNEITGVSVSIGQFLEPSISNLAKFIAGEKELSEIVSETFFNLKWSFIDFFDIQTKQLSKAEKAALDYSTKWWETKQAIDNTTSSITTQAQVLATSKEVIDGAIVTVNLYTEAEIEAAKAAGLLVENVPTAADAVRDFEKAMLDAKEATKKAQREIDDTNRSFENMMSQIRYTGTEAEKFNITMFDVYDAMEKLGYSTDEIRAKWNEWGTDIKFIEDALKLLGLTAEQVNKLLENTGKITTKAVIDIAALQAEIARLYAGGASPAEKEQAILQYQQGRMGYKTEADYLAGTKSGSFIGMQHGGIVTRPTLGLVGEAGPEAVIPLDNMGREVNIFVELDSKIIARAIGLPLVEEIRARTGLK